MDAACLAVAVFVLHGFLFLGYSATADAPDQSSGGKVADYDTTPQPRERHRMVGAIPLRDR